VKSSSKTKTYRFGLASVSILVAMRGFDIAACP
jgi:hypothetical protein